MNNLSFVFNGPMLIFGIVLVFLGFPILGLFFIGLGLEEIEEIDEEEENNEAVSSNG